MSEFLNFIGESLDNRIDDLATVFFIGVVALTTIYWLNLKLSGIIKSQTLRRNLVVMIIILIAVIYYIGVRSSIDVILLIQITSVWFCFNVYHIVINYLAKDNRTRLRSIFVFFFICVAMIGSYWLIYTNKISNENLSDDEIAKRLLYFKKLIPYYVTLALLISSIEAQIRYLFKLQEYKRKGKELETLKLKEQLTKAQLDALHAKVNPHFLYNSLNSIAGLALTDGQKTQQMAVSLSKFFRYSINHKEDNLVTVGEELEMVETYLKIEQIRFEERLSFEIIKSPGTGEVKIPRFILQPLVENSVKHGMKGNEHNLFIRIQAQMEGKKLSLSVEDDGQPFGDDLKPGYGLKSIYDKLDILFPEKYEVALYNEPVKQVRILIET